MNEHSGAVIAKKIPQRALREEGEQILLRAVRRLGYVMLSTRICNVNTAGGEFTKSRNLSTSSPQSTQLSNASSASTIVRAISTIFLFFWLESNCSRQAAVEVFGVHALRPAVADFVVHRPADEIQPRFIESRASLVRTAHPAHHRGGVGQELESPFDRLHRLFSPHVQSIGRPIAIAVRVRPLDMILRSRENGKRIRAIKIRECENPLVQE